MHPWWSEWSLLRFSSLSLHLWINMSSVHSQLCNGCHVNSSSLQVHIISLRSVQRQCTLCPAPLQKTVLVWWGWSWGKLVLWSVCLQVIWSDFLLLQALGWQVSCHLYSATSLYFRSHKWSCLGKLNSLVDLVGYIMWTNWYLWVLFGCCVLLVMENWPRSSWEITSEIE